MSFFDLNSNVFWLFQHADGVVFSSMGTFAEVGHGIIVRLGATVGARDNIGKASPSTRISQAGGSGTSLSSCPATIDRHLVPNGTGNPEKYVIDDCQNPGRHIQNGQKQLKLSESVLQENQKSVQKKRTKVLTIHVS